MKIKITQFQFWTRNCSRFMLAIAFSSISFTLQATNFYFVKSGGGAWETLSNWKAGSLVGATATVLPVAGDAVFLDGPSIQGGTVTIASGTNATITRLSMENCKLVNSGTLNVQGYTGATASFIITLGSATLQNDGALTIKNSSSAANALIILASDAANTPVSSQFINYGTLTLDNTAWTAPTNVFTFTQKVSGTQPKVTLNGTVDKYLLTLKAGTTGTYLFYNAISNCSAIVDGNATITTPVGTQLCAVLNNTTTYLTFAATSTLIFNAGSVTSPVQYLTTSLGANIINNGNLTINSLTSMSQAIYLANGNFTNNADATLTVKGKITNAVGFGTTSLSSFTNNGTLDFDNSSSGTGAVVSSSAGGGNENFTNAGTIIIKAATGQAAFAFGNSTAYPTVVFTNSGTIKMNSYITSGGAAAATPYKYNNSGTFDFDVASNTGDAIKVANFINTGTVKGRGKISGFTASTGTISPGNTSNAYGIFDFTDANVTLSGTINMDINGTTTAGTDYDQIKASTASSILNVIGATLNVTKSSSYSPVNNHLIPLFTALSSVTTPFNSVSLPTNWAMDYTTSTDAKVKFSATAPSLNTIAVSSIALTTAYSGGNISYDGGSAITVSGICWSTSQNPTITDSKTTDGVLTGSFNGTLTNLSPNTTYYVRAYATNSINTSYGTQVSFKTLSTINVSGSTNASTLPDCTTCDVDVTGSGFLTVDVSKTYNSITIAAGGKLTNAIGSSLTLSTLNLNSDASGTGTFLDNGISNITNTNVQQYLTAGRNWYVSSPLTTVQATALSTATSVQSYNELTAAWVSETLGLTPMKGYVSVTTQSDGRVTFSGTLNTGSKSINLTRTAANVDKSGFNLVGNPYPSYVNWESAVDPLNTGTTNLLTTMWYRSKNTSTPSAYIFDTYNAFDHIGTKNMNGITAVTALIPPMQAFWVRVAAGKSTGTLAFDNAMRAHADAPGNILKIKAVNIQQVLRIQVSNATNNDEAIVLFNCNASDAYDGYDSPKMSNANNAVPEIYTLAGTEQLVINGLNSSNVTREMPLGFTTGESNSFTIKATEISNFEDGTKIILKDKLLDTEKDITDGTAYSFTSATTSNASRFSLIFKTSSVTTDVVDKNGDNNKISIYKNTTGQISVNCPIGIVGHGTISVYNAFGQKLENMALINTITLLNNIFTTGVYFVTVIANGKITTRKVVFN